jgi:hypothetical protein
LEAGGDIAALQRFIGAQIEAFRKILKKYKVRLVVVGRKKINSTNLPVEMDRLDYTRDKVQVQRAS